MSEITFEQGIKVAIFQGKRYYLRESQGYYYRYAQKGEPSLLHRMVYISHYGEIKKGYEIHHKDGNATNNEIENLECLSIRKHNDRHKEIMSEDLKERLRAHLRDNALPKAAEWHGSTVGIEWHKQHYRSMSGLLHQKSNYVCKWCGKNYTTQKKSNNMFCSATCRNSDRYSRGVDNEKRVCASCGNEFEANKYQPTITCSRKCGAAHRVKAIRANNKDRNDYTQ